MSVKILKKLKDIPNGKWTPQKAYIYMCKWLLRPGGERCIYVSENGTVNWCLYRFKQKGKKTNACAVGILFPDEIGDDVLSAETDVVNLLREIDEGYVASPVKPFELFKDFGGKFDWLEFLEDMQSLHDCESNWENKKELRADLVDLGKKYGLKTSTVQRIPVDKN